MNRRVDGFLKFIGFVEFSYFANWLNTEMGLLSIISRKWELRSEK